MKATADQYYKQQNLMDFRLLSSYGFTQQDVEQLAAHSGVDAAMAGYGMDVLVQHAEGVQAVYLSALPAAGGQGEAADLNRLELVEGCLPAARGECLVDSTSAYQLGDVITLSPENTTQTLELAATRSFTVVGRGKSPMYVAFLRGNTNIGNGRISFFMYVDASSFSSEYYTEIFLRLTESREISSFSPRYDELVEDTKEQLEALGKARAQLRYDEVYGEAQQELADARAELADARKEADEQLADAWQQIEDGERELADGWAEYRDAQQQIHDAETQIQDSEAQLAGALPALQDGQAQYDVQYARYAEGLAQYNAAQANIDALYAGVGGLRQYEGAMQAALAAGDEAAFLAAAQGGLFGLRALLAQLATAGIDTTSLAPAADGMEALLGQSPPDMVQILGLYGAALAGTDQMLAGIQAALAPTKAELDAAGAQLAQAQATLQQGWGAYHNGLAGIQAAKAELADAKAELADAKAKLDDAETELADGRAEYETESARAKEEIADAQQKLDDAEAELADMPEAKWYVRTRADNPGYSGFASDADRINAIAQAIPAFFFLVAVLVCLTTMTRMVEEQRTFIGTMKAMGYSRFSIMAKYLLYAGIASATGAVLGVVVGFAVFPMAIWEAYSILYELPPISLGSSPHLAVFSVLICVACTTLATLFSCVSTLRSVPASLMRPKPPKAGKRVWLEHIRPVWARLSFMAKVTVRNLFRYKKRFFMTVVGVAGCTALLLTGFGLRDAIAGIVPRQYEDIVQYQIVAALGEESGSGQDTELNAVLPELGSGLYVAQQLVEAENGQKTSVGMTVYAYVAEEPARLPEFVALRERKGQQPIPFPAEDGVVITEKLADRLSLQPGDTMYVNLVNEAPVPVRVAAVCENYILNYVFLTQQQYTQLFGAAPEYSSLLLKLDADTEPAAALNRVMEQAPVAGAMNVSEMEGQFTDMFASLDAVIWLIIAAAALLAFVVLYNLTNINITERMREIATLKVLGFYNGEVASYVYRENIVLTLIGAGVGLVLGVFLHDFVVVTAEVDEVMFRRVVEPLSYLYSVLFTLLCAGIVNLVMLKRLRSIDMVESLKSSE